MTALVFQAAAVAALAIATIIAARSGGLPAALGRGGYQETMEGAKAL